MAEEELQIVRLRTQFYRDGFSKVLIAMFLVIAAIITLIAISIYLHLTKPDPVSFATDSEFRILAPVPLDKPYLSNADLLQWVSEALPASFTYDFLNYNSEQQMLTQYYTSKGWQSLLGQLNNYHADFNSLQNAKMFVNATLTGAPIILSQGVLPEGKYAWRVQMPMNVRYSNLIDTRSLVIIVLVVRIPTLDNYYGVGIEDLNITASQGSQVNTNV